MELPSSPTVEPLFSLDQLRKLPPKRDLPSLSGQSTLQHPPAAFVLFLPPLPPGGRMPFDLSAWRLTQATVDANQAGSGVRRGWSHLPASRKVQNDTAGGGTISKGNS